MPDKPSVPAMHLEQLILKYPLLRKTSSAYYYYRENRWRLLRYFVRYPDTIRLNKPIFLLGTQGGGLTFTSRIIRRHPDVVSASGNDRYWAGQDECQNMYRDLLPEALSWVDVRIPGQESADHNWLYANDAHIGYYEQDADKYSPALETEYNRFIYMVLALNGSGRKNQSLRFIDKSQSLSVRVGLVDQLLKASQPRFLLIMRNPVVMCWRAASKDAVLSRLQLTIEDKVDLAIQHWKNSMNASIQYENTDVALQAFRFEDILIEPQEKMRQIFDFLELDFSPAYMPGPEDRIPFGSMFDAFNKRKWYPVRADLNERYLKEIPDWAEEKIRHELKDLMNRLGYD